jgi:hypothetical protein
MNYLKMIGLATLAAMAMTVVAVGSASATTLEVGGVVQNKAITLTSGATASLFLTKTDGSELNTCSESRFQALTSVFSGAKVTGSLSTLSFNKCSFESVTVDSAGGLYIEWESGTTSGSMFSENVKTTVPTAFGFTVTCETGTGTKVGTFDGVQSSTSEHATITINAVLNCGFLVPSATWKGTYKISSPTGLGVVS